MLKGQYITNGTGRRKVLERLGDLVFISYPEKSSNIAKLTNPTWETTMALDAVLSLLNNEQK